MDKKEKHIGIVVMGAVFVDIKGFPNDRYLPEGRNAGHIEYIHGGVSRNVVEDIANLELRPTFLGVVDESALGEAVLQKLSNHKVNIDYVKKTPNGMGTWLAVFDQNGDLAGSISQRPDLSPVLQVLEESGDEVFQNADSIVIEIDMDKAIVKKVVALAKKFNKKLYAVVSNMQIALERRDLIKEFDCFICNKSEAGLLFAEDYDKMDKDQMQEVIARRVKTGGMKKLIVTLGGEGAVYADQNGNHGFCPPQRVNVRDTTGAGDAFCAGVVSGLTYGKTLEESVVIGSRLAASVITSSENVIPRFLPEEFGIELKEC